MKTGNKEELWKMILCRGSTNSPIDIHKSSLELSYLFGTTRLDSYSTQNQNSYWKQRKIRINQDMVVYYLRKWDFDSKYSKWIFKIDFQRDLLRKVFCFKIKEINLKTIKRMRNKIPSKTKENKITK